MSRKHLGLGLALVLGASSAAQGQGPAPAGGNPASPVSTPMISVVPSFGTQVPGARTGIMPVQAPDANGAAPEGTPAPEGGGSYFEARPTTEPAPEEPALGPTPLTKVGLL